MRRNPLIFDNRFDPEEARGSGSRVIASLTAPPKQRAQVARLADSPHTVRVILYDKFAEMYKSYTGVRLKRGQRTRDLDLAALSQPGCITLLISLAVGELDERSGDKHAHKTEGLARFSAFVLLHRLGDTIYPSVEGALFPSSRFSLDHGLRPSLDESDFYFPGEISSATRKLARNLRRGLRGEDTDLLHRYIVSHTNSQMSREGVFDEEYFQGEYGTYARAAGQCIADWVALSELPSARARPGRGEPWLLFPPKPGEYPPNIEKKLKKFSENINTYFPPFIQSLLDDLDGAVFRLY